MQVKFLQLPQENIHIHTHTCTQTHTNTNTHTNMITITTSPTHRHHRVILLREFEEQRVTHFRSVQGHRRVDRQIGRASCRERV